MTRAQNNVFEGDGEIDVALKKTRVTNHIRHPVLLHEACALTLVGGKPIPCVFAYHPFDGRSCATVAHPNIPQIFAWGRWQYFKYMAMELLGRNFEDVVSAAGGLSQRNAVALICQMVRPFHFPFITVHPLATISAAGCDRTRPRERDRPRRHQTVQRLPRSWRECRSGLSDRLWARLAMDARVPA